jgi:hypothetical protein
MNLEKKKAANRPVSIGQGTALAAALLVAAMAASGCSKRPERPRVPTTEARGQVLLDGKPLAGALVILHPQGVDKVTVDGAKEPVPDPSARGVSQADGRFTLSTYDTGDGAAEGEYAVTVVHRPAKKTGESFEPGPNVLPPRYASAKTSGLRATIADGENELPPFALKQAEAKSAKTTTQYSE